MPFIHNGLRIQLLQNLIQLDNVNKDEINVMKHHGGGDNPTTGLYEFNNLSLLYISFVHR